MYFLPEVSTRSLLTSTTTFLVEVIKFPMLQLNDARVQRIIHERARYLDFTGSQTSILCRIILLQSTSEDHAWNIRGSRGSWENRDRAVFMFSLKCYQRIPVIEPRKLWSDGYVCTRIIVFASYVYDLM